MNIKPIEIDVEDNRKFSLIALLVDRDDFLGDVESIRKQLGVKNIPYVFPSLLSEEANKIVGFYKKHLLTISNVRTELQDLCLGKNLSLCRIDNTLGMAFIHAQVLLKKYKKSRLYLPVMLSSILVGKVSNFDFSSTHFIDLKLKDMYEETLSVESDVDTFAIVVNRESTIDEVHNIFNYICKYYFGTRKIGTNDGLAKIYNDNLPKDKLADNISTIREVRKWYWWNKIERLGAKRILDRLGEKANITQKGIEQAIIRYKRNLHKPL